MGFVPLHHQYYEGATTSCFPFRRLSFPSVGDTVSRADHFVSCHHAPPKASLHDGAWGLELFIPLSPPVF